MSSTGRKTILDVLQRTESFFQERLGLDRSASRLDAQVLLAHVLGLDRVQLYVQHDRPLVEAELSAYRELVRRRAMHEPVAYLLGQREFWSLPLKVDRKVLIPRPDSECLVELALELCRDRHPSLMADVGTGSGALICALAREFPEAQALAMDLEGGALEVAADNLERLGLSARVRCVESDLLEALPESVDLLVGNLPYIPSGDLKDLALDIRDYEPLSALDGGDDGLDFFRRLMTQLPDALRPGAWVLLEVGAGQATEVGRMLEEAGLGEPCSKRDLGGVERVMAARRGSW